MNDLSRATVRNAAKPDASEALGLDAFTRDGQFVGRVKDYLPAVEEGERSMHEGRTDSVGPDGRRRGVPHLLVDGAGTVIQSTLIVTVDALEIDLPGRRVTLPVSLGEIEAMPQHDPNQPSPRAR